MNDLGGGPDGPAAVAASHESLPAMIVSAAAANMEYPQTSSPTEPPPISASPPSLGVSAAEAGQANFISGSHFYYVIVTKLIFLIWDVSGLIINGLGIDLMWYGIEVNHVVYNLVFQVNLGPKKYSGFSAKTQVFSSKNPDFRGF